MGKRFFLAGLAAALVGLAPYRAIAAFPVAPDANSVAILTSTVSGGCILSSEYAKAIALGKTPVCIDPAAWGTMTTADFDSYRAVVFGDPTCIVGTAPVAPAIANQAVWGPAIDGSIVIVGTDPVYHSLYGPGGAQGGDQVTENCIAVAASDPAKTGACINMSCYYHGTAPGTPVPLLDPFGSFTVTGVGCYNDAHVVAVHPALSGLTDLVLSNWSCSVHEAFDSYPSDVLPLAIAKGIGGAGSKAFADGTFGIPYILARGEQVSPILCGNDIVEATEECDDGNTTNGDGCSAQCTIEVLCGNGILNEDEECDDGNNTNGDGCSATCEFENKKPGCDQATLTQSVLWPPNHGLNNIEVVGVTDPDGDPVVTTITSVMQDEPLDNLGDGDTELDAVIYPDGTADVRAERSGTQKNGGNGRVYVITFEASDGAGGTCTGEVTLCVPHDVKDSCVQDAPLYNSY